MNLLTVFFILFITPQLLFSMSCPPSISKLALVNLTDNSTFQGELIETYTDRWFWQQESSDTPKYILLFKLENKQPTFKLINLKDIKEISYETLPHSSYAEYLKRHNIVLQNPLIENEHTLTGNSGHHKFEKMLGNFAWDIGLVDEKGLQFKDKGEKLTDYFAFGKTVRSPLNGTVVGRANLEIDNLPAPKFDKTLPESQGNYLTLLIKYPFYLSIVHFQEKSIKVNIGDQISAGQPLGQLGNSGISYTPHIHYTLYVYLEEQRRFISVPVSKLN